MPGVEEQYFIYENRLATFNAPRPVLKQRTSSASSRAPKTLQWPHKSLSPVEFAKAGFYFQPLPGSPDNVVCFLCQKSMDGWEDDDQPLVEHLRHSEDCGWALTAAVEAEMPEYASLHPLESRMLNARKATFAGRWPYESKKGFKCKTKQLIEAGWKYTPTSESDDMATCAYCQLALDGWDPSDKPIEEHYKRSPNCPFFAMLDDAPVPPKKGRSKTARSSKASRLSAQSMATAPSVGDMTVDHADNEDSVMTTTSVMTQGGKKGRVRKAPAAKGRKTRAKQDDPVEIHEDEPQDEEMPPPPLPPKAARGRKRASDAMEESVMTNSEAPAPKKRATRAKVSAGVDSSVLVASETAHKKQPVGRKKVAAGTAKTTRKVSQSSLRSQASTASLRGRGRVVGDDELDRQLQADLDRPLTDDNSDSDMKTAPASIALAPAREQPSKGTTTRRASAQSQKQADVDFEMFDPTPFDADDQAVDAEMKVMEGEVAEENMAAKDDVLQVPKKGRKAGTRKVSKQTKKAKDQVSVSAPVDVAMEDNVHVENEAPQPPTDHDTTITAPPPATTRTPSKVTVEHAAPPASPGSPTPVRVPTTATPTRSARPENSLAPPPSANQGPTPTTRRGVAPVMSTTPLSPSLSPQASDAENQPPSSRPPQPQPQPPATTRKRVLVLDPPVTATPARNPPSPSRRNIVAGLRSAEPWTAADIELVFAPITAGIDNDKENGAKGVGGTLLRQGMDLTTPERHMTVEEWIYHNASLAEQKLRHDCEAMISAFESEGTRAMRALEGLIVD